MLHNCQLQRRSSQLDVRCESAHNTIKIRYHRNFGWFRCSCYNGHPNAWKETQHMGDFGRRLHPSGVMWYGIGYYTPQVKMTRQVQNISTVLTWSRCLDLNAQISKSNVCDVFIRSWPSLLLLLLAPDKWRYRKRHGKRCAFPAARWDSLPRDRHPHRALGRTHRRTVSPSHDGMLASSNQCR